MGESWAPWTAAATAALCVWAVVVAASAVGLALSLRSWARVSRGLANVESWIYSLDQLYPPVFVGPLALVRWSRNPRHGLSDRERCDLARVLRHALDELQRHPDDQPDDFNFFRWRTVEPPPFDSRPFDLTFLFSYATIVGMRLGDTVGVDSFNRSDDYATNCSNLTHILLPTDIDGYFPEHEPHVPRVRKGPMHKRGRRRPVPPRLLRTAKSRTVTREVLRTAKTATGTPRPLLHTAKSPSPAYSPNPTRPKAPHHKAPVPKPSTSTPSARAH